MGYNTRPCGTLAENFFKVEHSSACFTLKYLSEMYDFYNKLYFSKISLCNLDSNPLSETFSRACATPKKIAEQILFPYKRNINRKKKIAKN